MINTLPLEKMSLEEKLFTIESVWDDITHSTPEFKSPSWHKEILETREKNKKNGEEELIDWEVAKKSLRASLK